MDLLIFDSIISFMEMLTSCFFAAGIFRKDRKGKRTVLALIFFSVAGTILLTIRENIFLWIPDFVPSVLIFTLFSIMVCRTKWWIAVSWALANYLFIGIINVTTDYAIIKFIGLSPYGGESVELWIFSCILIRLGQLLLSEIIVCVWKRFPVSPGARRGSWKIIVVSSISIIMVWMLWEKRIVLSDEVLSDEVLYSNGLVCLLVLTINLAFLLFDEVLATEKHVEEELKTQNQIIELQVHSQDEVNSMYQSIVSLKHDMNNHLHTISGYMQVGEYAKAQEYVGKIAGKVGKIKSFHSGNTVVDALIGSKTALAEMNSIPVDVDLAVPQELKISDADLTVMIGNLYDNAIDANLRFEDMDKRFINIKILYDGGNILFMFENAAREEKQPDRKDVWRTTKKDSSMHGFGMKNIDRIMQKYSGYCERDLKDHVFRCRIRIPS